MPDRKAEERPTCNLGVLDLFLSDKLADDERLILEQHLDDCAHCRDQLEWLAAVPELWSEAHDALSAVDDFPASNSSRSPMANSSASSRADAEVARAEHIQAHLTPTDDPRMLGRFGGYEIAGVIGCGGMGVVLKGLDLALNRYVAIKVFGAPSGDKCRRAMRFAREARAAAAVVHENVIAIHAVSEANGLPYLIMPYVRGTSLQKRLDAQGPLAAAEILRIGMQAAAGLAAAHAQGLVHRDIKPANILLEDGVERLTITDFGLARAADDASLTRSGIIAGTPQFMSPEQARGDSIDKRSDLFSLGSVLYALCTGRAPFRAETSYGVLRRITDDTPRPIREINPEIPEWLARAIEKLHAKDPAGRYQSADEVAQLFEQCLAHVQRPADLPLPEALLTHSVTKTVVRRRPVRWLAGTTAAGLLLAAVGYALHDRSKENATGDRGVPNEESAAGSGERALAGPSAATRWNDGVTEQISELQEDVEEFEDAASQSWEVETSESRSR